MAKSLISLLDTEEVEQIVSTYYECDENHDAIVELLMKCVDDGTLDSFIYDTFETWAWENYWEIVQDAVTEWAKDVVSRADNTDRE